MLSTLCAYQLTMLIAVAFLCFSPGILPPSDVPPMWCSTSRWWPISSANSLSCHKCFERFTLTLTRIHMHLPHWLVCRNEIHGLSNFALEDTGSLCRSAAVCIHSATMPQVYLNVSLEDMERSCVPQLWRDRDTASNVVRQPLGFVLKCWSGALFPQHQMESRSLFQRES